MSDVSNASLSCHIASVPKCVAGKSLHVSKDPICNYVPEMQHRESGAVASLCPFRAGIFRVPLGEILFSLGQQLAEGGDLFRITLGSEQLFVTSDVRQKNEIGHDRLSEASSAIELDQLPALQNRI